MSQQPTFVTVLQPGTRSSTQYCVKKEIRPSVTSCFQRFNSSLLIPNAIGHLLFDFFVFGVPFGINLFDGHWSEVVFFDHDMFRDCGSGNRSIFVENFIAIFGPQPAMLLDPCPDNSFLSIAECRL